MEFIFSFLIFAVALVNGWTDAPSAIAGCVSTRSLTPRAALILAAICNFSGAVIMALIRPGVAKTLYGIADFGSEPRSAMISLGHPLGVLCLDFRSADEREPRADLGNERRGARVKSRSFCDTA